MTPENRELLFKDLCGRVPYEVIVCIDGTTNVKLASVSYWEEVEVQDGSRYLYDISDIKPYLFPLSSMTEEQRYEISSGLQNIHTEHPPFGKIESSGSDNCLECVTMASTWLIGYYNKNHFDYMGLIPMGLAIDCTNLNIY